MPFKSQAQKEKLTQLLKEGKISQKTFDEFDKHTKTDELPERLNITPKRVRVGKVKQTKVIK